MKQKKHSFKQEKFPPITTQCHHFWNSTIYWSCIIQIPCSPAVSSILRSYLQNNSREAKKKTNNNIINITFASSWSPSRLRVVNFVRLISKCKVKSYDACRTDLAPLSAPYNYDNNSTLRFLFYSKSWKAAISGPPASRIPISQSITRIHIH